MRKRLIFIVFALSFFSFPILFGQSNQREARELTLSRQPSPNLDVHIWMDNYFRFGHQAFTAKIKNISSKKMKLSGYLVATTVCGTEVSIDYSDIILEPGDQIGVGDVNMTPTIGAVFEKDCPNPKILHPYSDRPTSIEKNTIQSIQFRSFGAAAHEDQKFSNKAGIGGSSTNNSNNNAGNSQQIDIERQKQEQLEKQRKEQQDANNRRFEMQRQQQLSQVDNKMRQLANSNQAISDAMGSIFDYIINSMIQRSINNENKERNERFAELKNKISSTNGTLEECTSCNGSGNDPCDDCKSSGYKSCQSCNGNGQASCYYCKGTGVYFGRTCQFCNGNGSSKCTTCSGRGKLVCTSCNGLGHKQCVSCRGTGKQFKEHYSSNYSNDKTSNNSSTESYNYDNSNYNKTQDVTSYTPIITDLTFSFKDCIDKADEYRKNNDNTQAYKWFKKAADYDTTKINVIRGYYMLALYNTGYYLRFGVGTGQNSQNAFFYIKKAAIIGFLPAMLYLGQMYEKGEGTEKNLPEAINWYKKAAEDKYNFSSAVAKEASDNLKRLGY